MSTAPCGRLAAVGLLATASLSLPACLFAQSSPDLVGSWAAERYVMAAGGEHEVQGSIFFSGLDWQVLFFVIDETGAVKRGSAEGGTYRLVGDRLVLTHSYNLSAGDAMPGLAAQELRMVSRPPEVAPTEPTRIEVEGDLLTLFFPSGNRMTFRGPR